MQTSLTLCITDTSGLLEKLDFYRSKKWLGERNLVSAISKISTSICIDAVDNFMDFYRKSNR